MATISTMQTSFDDVDQDELSSWKRSDGTKALVKQMRTWRTNTMERLLASDGSPRDFDKAKGYAMALDEVISLIDGVK